MHVFSRVVYWVILTALFFNCGQQNQSEFNTKAVNVEIKPTSELVSFDVDEQTANISDYLAYKVIGEKEYLLSLNHKLNEIIVFDLQAKLTTQRFLFPVEGPMGVGQIQGFLFHNFDSIYLFGRNVDRVFLVDSSKNILERIILNLDENSSPPIVTDQYFRAVAGLNKGQLVFKSLQAGNFSLIENSQIGEYTIGGMLDLKTGNLTPSVATYPKDYWANGKTHFEYSFLPLPKNHLAYSFFADHHLYLSDNQEVIRTDGQSVFLNEQFDHIPLEGTRTDRRVYFATTQHYGNLYFDSFRGLIYRFAYPEVAIESSESTVNFIRFKKTFVIQVFNLSGNLLTEKLFKQANYLTTNVFVGKEGLYLSINYPDNPANNEDLMTFELFHIDTN